MLTVNLTAVAGSCGPGSLHFINGLVDANRNRAPVILIATRVASEEIGFNFPQEVDFKAIYGSCIQTEKSSYLLHLFEASMCRARR